MIDFVSVAIYDINPSCHNKAASRKTSVQPVVAVCWFFSWGNGLLIFMKCFKGVGFFLGEKVLKPSLLPSSLLVFLFASRFPVCMLSSCKLLFRKCLPSPCSHGDAADGSAWTTSIHPSPETPVGRSDISLTPPSHLWECNSFCSGLSNFSQDSIRGS